MDSCRLWNHEIVRERMNECALGGGKDRSWSMLDEEATLALYVDLSAKKRLFRGSDGAITTQTR